MAHVIPHINTLILDVGSKYTRVGYTGDFHPAIVEETPTEEFVSAASEYTLKVMEKYVKELGVDSLIVIESTAQDMEFRHEIIKQSFTKRLCSSLLFLKSPVCDAFGHGKTSCAVLSCSAGSMSASIVINGKIAETFKHSVGSILLEAYITDRIRELEKLHAKVLPPEQSLPRLVLESSETIDMLMEKFKVDVFQPIRFECCDLIDRVVEMRARHCINKKNLSNGCIVLSGGLFKYKPFLDLVKGTLISKLSDDFSDFILREKELDCTFAGASVFGMNDQTKPLYISLQDFQNIGMDAIALKSLDRDE